MASRYGPSVLPDRQPRDRPGLEVAAAFDAYRQDKLEDEDRQIEAEDRTRRRSREDIGDRAAQIEWEDFLYDRRGVTPPGMGPQQQTSQPQRLPPQARNIFENARAGMTKPTPQAEGAPRTPNAPPPPQEPGEIIALPGQFVGGTFTPQALRAQPRTVSYGGQEYEVDPNQTAEARAGRAQEAERMRLSEEERQAFRDEVESLRAARPELTPGEAEAIARFDVEEDYLQPDAGWDPDRPGKYMNEDDYVAFQRRLATARDAISRRDPRRGGGSGAPYEEIPLEDAFAEVDRLFGEWEDGELTGHTLSQAQRYDVARKMMRGELTVAELEQMTPEDFGVQEEEAEAVQYEHGPFKRFFERLMPGGRTGHEAVEPGTEPEGQPPVSRAGIPQGSESLEPPADTSGRGHNVPPRGRVSSAQVDSVRSFADRLRQDLPGISDSQVREALIAQFDPKVVDEVFRRQRR